MPHQTECGCMPTQPRPNPAKEAELPQESHISRKRVGRFRNFSSFFLHGSDAYILLFNTSIASLGTDECIARGKRLNYS